VIRNWAGLMAEGDNTVNLGALSGIFSDNPAPIVRNLCLQIVEKRDEERDEIDRDRTIVLT
jgi:hypothetical protein